MEFRPRPVVLPVLSLTLAIGCAALGPQEEGAGDQTAVLAANDPVPQAPPTGDGGSNTTPSTPPSSGENATATPVSTSAAKLFSGSPVVGFHLRSTDDSRLCLALRGGRLERNNTYTWATCANTDAQLFYWTNGLLAQTPNLVINGNNAEGASVTLNAPPYGYVGIGTQAMGNWPSTWVLSADSNTLYCNWTGGSWALAPTGSVTANGNINIKDLIRNTRVSARFSLSTDFAGPTKIYRKSSSGVTTCLSRRNDGVAMGPCLNGNSFQFFSFRNHNIISNAGTCLTAVASKAGSSVDWEACEANNGRQQWYLAGGAIALAAATSNIRPEGLVLDFNQSISDSVPVLGSMGSGEQTLWSIGAENFFR